MSNALVAGDLHLAADVGLHLTPEVALDLVVGVDPVAQLDQLVLGELVHPGARRDPGVLQGLVGASTADPVNVGECDLHPLLAGEVDAGNTCHMGELLHAYAEV